MADIQRQAAMDRERMAREVQERDALLMADAQQKRQDIDQLTRMLTMTLERLDVMGGPMASGGAPPPPPGGGHAPVGTGEKE